MSAPSLSVLPAVAHAQAAPAARARYPVRPTPLPEADEIRMAMSAAPRDVSSHATIYMLRDSGLAKVRSGTNGVSCMVARDQHEGSRYPICFDGEGSKTLLHQEMLELRLRVLGTPEEAIRGQVAAAYKSGTLKTPAKVSIAYMMSAEQVLFSSPLATGQQVGPWLPHVMISVPYATEVQFGLPPGGTDMFAVDRAGEPGAQLIVVVPRWADSTNAAKGR